MDVGAVGTRHFEDFGAAGPNQDLIVVGIPAYGAYARIESAEHCHVHLDGALQRAGPQPHHAIFAAGAEAFVARVERVHGSLVSRDGYLKLPTLESVEVAVRCSDDR
jgi:hypothetical protein